MHVSQPLRTRRSSGSPHDRQSSTDGHATQRPSSPHNVMPYVQSVSLEQVVPLHVHVLSISSWPPRHAANPVQQSSRVCSWHVPVKLHAAPGTPRDHTASQLVIGVRSPSIRTV